MDRPNILWICTDQQRFDTLGCNANSFVSTPHLDALSKDAASFTNAFVQSPICMPSRGSFLTGRYPRTTGLRQNGQSIPNTEKPISRLLADAGYHCGLVGKLHLAPSDPKVNETIEKRINDGYEDFSWAGDPQEHWGNHSGYTAFLSDHGVRFQTPQRIDCPCVEIGMPEEFHETEWCAQQAINFIKQAKTKNKPWLYSVNMFAPHHPFNPPEAYLSRYLDKLEDIALPAAMDDDLSKKSAYQNMDSEGAYGKTMPYHRNLSDRDHRMIRAAYWAMCDLVDKKVGAILAALEETEQRQNTIVIFMSDHGEMLGDHGLYLKGPYFYDPSIRVPLMIHLPNVIKPQRIHGLFELVDLVPTLLHACNVPIDGGIQGQSCFDALCKGEEPQPKESIYCEYYNAMPFHTQPTAQLTMVRTEHYKLIVDHANRTGEMYDLKHDPVERDNLWDSQCLLEIRARLLLHMTHRMAFTVDPLPPRISEW